MENKNFEKKGKLSIWKIIFLILSFLLIWAGLFGAGCWGFFTISFFYEGGGSREFIIIPISFFIWGLFLVSIWYFIRKKIKQNNINKK